MHIPPSFPLHHNLGPGPAKPQPWRSPVVFYLSGPEHQAQQEGCIQSCWVLMQPHHPQHGLRVPPWLSGWLPLRLMEQCLIPSSALHILLGGCSLQRTLAFTERGEGCFPQLPTADPQPSSSAPTSPHMCFSSASPGCGPVISCCSIAHLAKARRPSLQ